MNTNLRYLLTLAVFAVVGGGLYLGNANFTQFAPESSIGIAALGGLVCAAAFAYFTRPRDTASAPGIARIGSAPVRSSPRVRMLDRSGSIATPLSVVSERPAREPKPRTIENATFSFDVVEGKNIVTVKVNGMTGGQFKKNGGTRDRITSVGKVKWAHPKNDQAGKVITITGVVADNAEAAVRSALEQLGAKQSVAAAA